MKNEPRWVCSENSKHYQKMRESDLKLEKMAALIPTKTARKDVERYFAQRRKERDEANRIRSKGKKTAITSTEGNPADANSAEQIALF